MSEDNNSENAAQGLVNTLKNNPKAAYAIGGAAVIVALAIGIGGGSGARVDVKNNVSIGQTVNLRNPNIGDSQLTVSPGMMGVATSAEEEDQKVCFAKPNTQAVVEEEQVVGALPFVKVRVTDGDCAGKSGWTSKINVSAR